MATIAPQAMRRLADDWMDAIDSAILSGIVGDEAHRRQGGYHISREDNPPDNYSVQLLEDRQGHSDWAAAIDMSMHERDMSMVTQRLLTSAKDPNDPRLTVCREFYGTLNGRDVTGWDTYYGTPATADDSHLWHVHISFLRKYADDPAAMDAVLSIIKGEPYRPDHPHEEDDMPQGWGPVQLPTTPHGRTSYSIWPVDDGVAGFGPAWLTIWADLFEEGPAALRIAMGSGDGQFTVVTDRLVVESGKKFNMGLPKKTRGISITRLPYTETDPCLTSISMSIEYAPR